MAITPQAIDYTPAIRNSQIFIKLVASGSYTQVTGDLVNLANTVNVNGIDMEGLFETSIVPPTLEVIDLYATSPVGGYTCTLQVTGLTYQTYVIRFYAIASGAELAAGAYPAAITGGTIILACNRRSL
jgi:hypothetical protein